MAEPAPRGTAVILQLRDDAKEFLDEYPPAPDRAQLLRPHRGADPAAGRGQAGRRGNDEEAAAKEPEQINEASALWTRPKAEISDEQYKEFYHHVAHAFDDPWARLHVQAEGVVSYQALLFVPGTPPFDLYDPKRRARRQALRQAGVHHRRPRRPDAALSALRAEAWSIPRTCSSTSRARRCSTARCWPGSGKDLVKRMLDELDRRAKADDGRLPRNSGSSSARCSRRGCTRTTSSASGCWSWPASAAPRATAGSSLADYVGRMKPGQDAIFTISGENLEALQGRARSSRPAAPRASRSCC